jgi:hypothetical protein
VAFQRGSVVLFVSVGPSSFSKRFHFGSIILIKTNFFSVGLLSGTAPAQ